MSQAGALPTYRRPMLGTLVCRIREPRRFIQVLSGPRQAGKTTLARQAIADSGAVAHYASADGPGLHDSSWIEAQWEGARRLAESRTRAGALLVLDEVQKIPSWSESVKGLWDADTAAGRNLHVFVLGSAQLLVQHGLHESLAGRFETVHVPHWSFDEMAEAFDWDLRRYLFFGAYPGAAPLIKDPSRWRQYILESLVETTLSRDVLLLTRVDKPALLRQLFRLGCEYSGQILSYQKMLGQLQDAGNTTTLAHYLQLLGSAGMLTGLQKYTGSRTRHRGSIPKLLVLNTALMTAPSGLRLEEAREDRGFWGRVVETAVGAHLVNTSLGTGATVSYWRERNQEVDFVLADSRRTMGIEVKSGQRRTSRPGLEAFGREYPASRKLLIGADGLSIADALRRPADTLLGRA
ncbi:MAG: ATP-binding protein [Thermoplasmata archaeon]